MACPCVSGVDGHMSEKTPLAEGEEESAPQPEERARLQLVLQAVGALAAPVLLV